MKMIDKAIWQIDAGVSESAVLRHFETIFLWLDSKGMLTADGKEDLEFGIDDRISLNDRAIHTLAFDFLESNYDAYLSAVEYGNDEGGKVLERMYVEYESAKG